MRYIAFKGKVIELHQNAQGLWVDSDGGVYAFSENADSVDNRNVCGVGIFTLADDNPLNAACAPHDYAYSSPAYQAFHSRQEADFYLKKLIEQIPGYSHSVTATLFFWISRALGGSFWENESTNH